MWRSRAWTLAIALLVLLAIALSMLGFATIDDARFTAWAALTVGVLVVVWAVWRTRRDRRRYEAELAAWAAERAAQAERLRIARELHDLASHGLGAITLRASTARAAASEEERRGALGDIEATSRAATTELRRMLALLRSPSPAPLAPAESLDDLPGIVAEARAAGLDVRLEQGDLGEVTPGAQLTVCAILREGLRNIARHAGPAEAVVELRRTGEGLLLRLEDSGPVDEWSAQPGSGLGLQGLRERTDALGGALEAGPAGRGWRLVARIPDGAAS
ncbi:two-component system sensor kinase [Gulosibacter sp. 10]|nr:two-component system sensor kinase [Gulosibacter sp. 10]